MATASTLRQMFEGAGIYRPFNCQECSDRDVFVAGPHSHVCDVCGGRAFWGFYTTPRCKAHRTVEQGGTFQH